METISAKNVVDFYVPSGHRYTIREQNGNDDDIISNSVEAMSLMNISRFIAAIVVKTSASESGVLTAEQAHRLPSLDRYCILLNSRIFSFGPELEFTEKWGGNLGEVEYSQNLNEFLFKDYSVTPESDELLAKPQAIPYYPMQGRVTDLEFTTSSGKTLKVDILTGEGESWVINLPLNKQTRNSNLMARNLRLEVNGKFEKVTNFSSFSPNDMKEIRTFVRENDPEWTGVTTITHPETGESRKKYIFAIEDFFYPGEI